MKRLILLSFILLKFSVQSQTCTLTASKNPVCIGDTVWLFASNSFSATNFSWVGPNGFTSMNDTAKIIINSILYWGNYQCTISTGTTSLCLATIDLTVNPIPIMNIFYSVPSTCKPNCVSFLCSSMSTIQSYTWNFGNGNTSNSGPTANTCYSVNGLYTPSLAIIDNSGCKASTGTTISINSVASFSANFTYTIGNNGLVSFTDHSAGIISTWNWYFGSAANQSNLQNPNFIFTDTTQNYNVCLVIKTSSNCTDTMCKTISFNNAISVNEINKTKEVKLYPNPLKDHLEISGLPLTAVIEIYDVLGNLSLKQINTSDHIKINVSELNTGIYFVKITERDKGILTRKIIKE